MMLQLKLRSMAHKALVLLVALCAAGGGASAGGIAHPHPHPRMLFEMKQPALVLKYHGGDLLKGKYTFKLVWYGRFSRAQRAIVVDFLNSLSAPANTSRGSPPTVASWWRTAELYGRGSTTVSVGQQVLMSNYPRGKSLTEDDLRRLATPGRHRRTITVVLTAGDVVVRGFCMSSCGLHAAGQSPWRRHGRSRFAYIWVGNSATQCPGQCAWPFHRPIYGPQAPPLRAPNGDVGVDGMVINLATLVAGAVTNPFDGGFFQGPKEMPLEAVSACTGIFGSGAYPGYPGKVLVARKTHVSYNAVGINGRKYLLPAMWSPKTLNCATLV